MKIPFLFSLTVVVLTTVVTAEWIPFPTDPYPGTLRHVMSVHTEIADSKEHPVPEFLVAAGQYGYVTKCGYDGKSCDIISPTNNTFADIYGIRLVNPVGTEHHCGYLFGPSPGVAYTLMNTSAPTWAEFTFRDAQSVLFPKLATYQFSDMAIDQALNVIYLVGKNTMSGDAALVKGYYSPTTCEPLVASFAAVYLSTSPKKPFIKGAFRGITPLSKTSSTFLIVGDAGMVYTAKSSVSATTVICNYTAEMQLGSKTNMLALSCDETSQSASLICAIGGAGGLLYYAEFDSDETLVRSHQMLNSPSSQNILSVGLKAGASMQYPHTVYVTGEAGLMKKGRFFIPQEVSWSSLTTDIVPATRSNLAIYSLAYEPSVSAVAGSYGTLMARSGVLSVVTSVLAVVASVIAVMML